MRTRRSRTIGWHAEGTAGTVAAGAWDSVAAGLDILERGGNAVDAAVATILALSVTDYGLFAIGGECPMMIADARTGDTAVLSGLGTAPRDQKAVAWYQRHGIPADGDIRAALAPGAPDLCITALDLYGTFSFERVAEPTVDLLQAGRQSWHRALAKTITSLCETEHATPGSRRQKLDAVRARFYRGDIAERLARFYHRQGSFLSLDDLSAQQTRVERPVSITYGPYTVLKCGPWTQGPALCQALQILDTFDLPAMGRLSPDYIHTTVEALKLAFADRDHYYADPDFAQVPLQALLDPAYATLRRTLIDPRRAADVVWPGDPETMTATLKTPPCSFGTGGTTTCVVSDRRGNLVAATPSANRPYAVCEELGIAHGNRLRCLNTTPGHANSIQPGKRPRITLTPTLVLKDGQPVMAISVAGGDLQDQTTLNCLLDVVEFGMSPEEAVIAPRFSTEHHQNSFRPDSNRAETVVLKRGLTLDTAVNQNTARELAARGHAVRRSDRPIACPVMLCRDPETGVCRAAGDPRAGRHAGALRTI